MTRPLGPRPGLPPSIWLHSTEAQLPFPLTVPQHRLFPLRWQALAHGLRGLGLEPGAEVLAPTALGDHEREALQRAGLSVRHYAGFAPPEDEPGERVRALYLVHWLGFPQAAAEWRAYCDRHELKLIEDASQAWLAWDEDGTVGSHGDIALFSPEATFGLPIGGLLTWREEAGEAPEPGAGSRPLDRARLHWPRLWQRGDGDSAVSPAARDALPRAADPGAGAIRRAHFEVLLDALGDHVPPPFSALPAGAAPLVFPFAYGPGTQEQLARAGIVAPRLALPDALGLPVHQGLRQADLERIVGALGHSRRAPAPPLRVERLESLPPERDEWRELALQADNVFLTPEWIETWWRHLGEGRPECLTCRGPDGRLLAVAALSVTRVWGLRVARLAGHGPGDQLGVACRPGDRTRVAGALRAALLDDGIDLFVGDGLPEQEGWRGRLDATLLDRDASPAVRLRDEGWEELLARKSWNFRRQVRKRERALLRDHSVRYLLTEEPGRLDADMELLMRLHDARWEGASRAFAGPRRAFHHDFARQALERGWLRLRILELDDRPVAASLGFRFGGVESNYQTGRDPGFSESSVGFVLLCHSIREALEDGMREWRFLLGDEPYKGRFADHDRGLERVVLPLSRRGRAALAARDARLAGKALARRS